MDEATIKADDELISSVHGLRMRTMKDMFVFAMAMATPTRPGARARAVNAARRLDAVLKEYK